MNVKVSFARGVTGRLALQLPWANPLTAIPG